MSWKEFSTDDLEQQLAAAGSLISRAIVIQLEVLEELDRRQVATGDGMRSLSSWAAARMDLSLDTARSLVRTMRRTSERDDLREALADGVATFDRVEAVSRIPQDVGLLEHLDIGGVNREAAKRVGATAEEFRGPDERFLVMQPSLDESWWKIWGGLDAYAGALVDKTLAGIADELPDLPDGTKGEQAWRKATALFELCTSYDAPPANVSVFVDATHAAQSNGTTGVVLEAGPAVSLDALEAIFCNATTEVIARTEDGRYLDYGRRHRTAPPALRRALLDKYLGACAIDGCDSRYRLEVHHIVPWSEGGRTDQDELMLACWFHHQVAIHELGFEPFAHPDHGRIRLRKPQG